MTVVVGVGCAEDGGDTPAGAAFKVDMLDVDAGIDDVDVDILSGRVWIEVVGAEWESALRDAWQTLWFINYEQLWRE